MVFFKNYISTVGLKYILVVGDYEVTIEFVFKGLILFGVKWLGPLNNSLSTDMLKASFVEQVFMIFQVVWELLEFFLILEIGHDFWILLEWVVLKVIKEGVYLFGLLLGVPMFWLLFKSGCLFVFLSIVVGVFGRIEAVELIVFIMDLGVHLLF